MVARCGERLADVLQGTCDALSLLFPNDLTNDLTSESQISAADIYQHGFGTTILNGLVKAAVAQAVAQLPPHRI